MLCITNPNSATLTLKESSLRRQRGKRQCSNVKIRCESTNSSRREFVLGSSIGLAAVGACSSIPQAVAAPVELSNLRSCSRATLPQGVNPIDCCPPSLSSTPIEFSYNTALPARQRPAAHRATADYVSKYSRAYQLMRSLPASDPRSYTNQANVHCAYCNDSFRQSGGSNAVLQIHNSWLFLPWHRWYLYFHERILATLIGDDTFALPYWNWDDQSAAAPVGNVIPSVYLNNPPLFDALRDALHMPPRVVDLNGGREAPAAAQRAENNALMYQQIVSGARTASLFHGLAYRSGDADTPGAGTIENAPHGPVHVWTGSSQQPNNENMGTLYSAARDPIFFAHHANLDRLWGVWRTIPGGRRQDFTDPDWLDASFLFYDENARLVRVRVRDALDPGQLGYSYSASADAWLTARPTVLGRSSGGVASVGGGIGAAIAAENGEIEEIVSEVRKLEKVFKCKVKRSAGRRSGDEVEEVLVVDGVEIECNSSTKFDVYINLPEAGDGTSCNVVEFVGTFVNVPHFHSGMKMPNGGIRKASVRLGIGETIEQLGLIDADEIVVTLVPRQLGKKFAPVVFKNIRIEYE